MCARTFQLKRLYFFLDLLHSFIVKIVSRLELLAEVASSHAVDIHEHSFILIENTIVHFEHLVDARAVV